MQTSPDLKNPDSLKNAGQGVYLQRLFASGRNPRRANAVGPANSVVQGRRIRTDISSLVRAGVLPLDEP